MTYFNITLKFPIVEKNSVNAVYYLVPNTLGKFFLPVTVTFNMPSVKVYTELISGLAPFLAQLSYFYYTIRRKKSKVLFAPNCGKIH